MLKKKEKQAEQIQQVDGFLEIDASMQGALTFKDPVNLRINGNFEGTLDTKGTLIVGEEAVVRAQIKGERVILEGEIIGDLTLSKSLELKSKARLIGDVQTASLSMESGAILQGQVSMITAKTQQTNRTVSEKRTSLTADELANYLSVDKPQIFEWADHGKLPGVREGKNWKFDKDKVDEWVASGRMK